MLQQFLRMHTQGNEWTNFFVCTAALKLNFRADVNKTFDHKYRSIKSRSLESGLFLLRDWEINGSAETVLCLQEYK